MRYARIENDTVVELFETDEDITQMFHQSLVWVPCPDPLVAYGWRFDGASYSPPSSEPIPEVPSVTEAPPVVISSDIITVADADLFLIASKEKGADGQPTSGALMAQWLINKLNL